MKKKTKKGAKSKAARNLPSRPLNAKQAAGVKGGALTIKQK